MKTIKKITKGKLKGWNIRQTKDNRFHPYIGVASQSIVGFCTLKSCEDWMSKQVSQH